MRISRECFTEGKIGIITNGILLPKMPESFWECCRNYKVDIEPTKYPINFDYAAMEKKAKEEGVRYYYVNAHNVKTLDKRPLDMLGNQPVFHNFLNCPRANECIVLKHGRLYTCSAAPHASIINDYFDCKMDLSNANSIDIYMAGNRQEIMNFLANPIPFCKYCKIDSAKMGYKYTHSDKKINEWT